MSSHPVQFRETGSSFIDVNKVELFSLLESSVTAIDTDSEKQIPSTHHAEVICSQSREVSGLAPYTHEEADTCILLHVQDPVKEGYKKVSVCTVDMDVLVVAVTAAQRLNINELWVVFGVGKSFHYLAAREMAKALGPDKCTALPMFHAFAGCDMCHVLKAVARRQLGISGRPLMMSHQPSVPWVPAQIL